jgi:hypothetical protein
MPRYLGRHPIGYSARSGFKTRHADLVEDGEIRGLRVKKGEEDQEHPQKFRKPVGADKINLYRPQPENYKSPVTILVGWNGGSNLFDSKTGMDALNISTGYFQIVFRTDIADVFGYDEGGYSEEGYGGYDVDETDNIFEVG